METTYKMKMGRSRVMEALHLQPMMDDFDLETKVRTIDADMESEMEDELKDTDTGFKLEFEKLLQRLGVSIIDEIQKGNGLKLLDRMFAEVGIKNKMSPQTFLKKMREEFKGSKIAQLKDMVKKLELE